MQARNEWFANRIESTAGNGIFDVTFASRGVTGWIEIKYRPLWPVRDRTIVKVPLRPEQKVWLIKRSIHDKNLWVFIRIENDFFLLNAKQALHLTDNGATQADWKSGKYAHWENRVYFPELGAALRRNKQ